MSLYLKYRPQKISDLDLDDVREVLTRMIQGGKIPHALLLAGPRGTGKTSTARILAKVLNCEENEDKIKEPCNRCGQCVSITSGSNIDVIEIDAASHRGIEDARTIIESARLSPAKARNKIYIIDEAHMLTPEASNALLKTLEEPPPGTFFFLATTEPNKLMSTIRSRTTIVNFKKATVREIALSLEKKAKAEGKDIDKEALNLIASRSDGSFRDAVKILEEIFNENIELTFEKVSEYIDKSAPFDIGLFLEKLLNKDLHFVLNEIRKVSESGLEAEIFVDKVLSFVRDELLASLGLGELKLGSDSRELLLLVDGLLEVKRKLSGIAGFEFLPLEVFVINYCEREGASGDRQGKSENRSELGEIKRKERLKSEAAIIDDSLFELKWKDILNKVGLLDISVEALLRAAKPLKLEDGVLEIGVYYSFHKGKLEEFKHREILERVCSDIFGRNIKIVCSLIEPPQVRRVNSGVVLSENADEDIVEVAKKIFSG